MIRWLTITVVALLLVIGAIYATRGKPEPAEARLVWTNSEAVYYFSTVLSGPQGPMVEGKDGVHLLDPLTGEIVSTSPAVGGNLSYGPDGKGVVETYGRLERLGFPKSQLLVNLGDGVKRIELLPSGEFTGRPNDTDTLLYNAAGKPVWPKQWPGKLLAFDTTSNVYGHAFGWVFGIDRKSGQVVWDERSQIEPQPLGRHVVILRGGDVRALGNAGNVVWSTSLGEKLLDARVYDRGIYVLSESQLFHLSRQGKLRWKRPSEGGSFSHVSRSGLALILVRYVDMSEDLPSRMPQDRESYKLVAVRRDGSELWNWDTKGAVYGAAVQSDGGTIQNIPAERVYVSTFEEVVALDPPR